MKVLIVSSFLSDGSGEINHKGVDHYNNLINALLAKGKLTYLQIRLALIYIIKSIRNPSF